MSESPIYITLVHGTFATRAAWTMPESEFRTNLQKLLREGATFHRFEWSGWPSHIARNHAAKRFREFMSSKLLQYPTAQHFVIAHSHGGNVVLYALRDRSLNDRIKGVITLSTPFLVPRSRDLNSLGIFALDMIGVGSFLLASALIMDRICSLWLNTCADPPDFWERFQYYHSLYTTVFMIAVLIAAGFSAGLFLLFKHATQWFKSTLALPNLSSEQLLIVRGPSDEANALFIAVQLLEIIVSGFWTWADSEIGVSQTISSKSTNVARSGPVRCYSRPLGTYSRELVLGCLCDHYAVWPFALCEPESNGCF